MSIVIVELKSSKKPLQYDVSPGLAMTGMTIHTQHNYYIIIIIVLSPSRLL